MKNKYRILSSNGIDEKSYIEINGQKQYIYIRGKDISNPIILHLHGGPANPDSFSTYDFAKEIVDDFTYVSWDQRGCGRTYYKNMDVDSENETADFEQALKDVDKLVKHLCSRFQKDKVIIMGHSYGSLLGISYVSKHPERVDSYVGIGQTVSIKDTQAMNYSEAISLLKSDNRKIEQLATVYQKLKSNFTVESYMKFQQLTLPRLTANAVNLKQANQIKLLFSSPDVSMRDIRWLLSMLNIKGYYRRNKKLLDYTFLADINDLGIEFPVPVYFISGEYDKQCRVDLLKEYFDKIYAPAKKLVTIKQCGHAPQLDNPTEFADEVKKLLINQHC